MQRYTASQAKQSFGELLRATARGPVEIEKHGKVQAIVLSPEAYAEVDVQARQRAERRAARAQQQVVERDRLIRHQALALTLLGLPRREQALRVAAARAVVARWREESLCSQDYIERWEALLALPIPELAQALGSDLEGWGPALRQNSPWSGLPA